MSWQSEATRQLHTRLVPGASAAGAEALMARMTRVDVKPGGAVVHEGSTERVLWFVHTGSLEVVAAGRDGDAVVATVSPGHWVGEISLLDGGAASATVRAASDAALLRLDEDALLALREEHPDVAVALLRSLSQELVDRIRDSDQRLRSALDAPAPAGTSPFASLVGFLFGGSRA